MVCDIGNGSDCVITFSSSESVFYARIFKFKERLEVLSRQWKHIEKKRQLFLVLDVDSVLRVADSTLSEPAERVKKMGDVSFVIAPDLEHFLYKIRDMYEIMLLSVQPRKYLKSIRS